MSSTCIIAMLPYRSPVYRAIMQAGYQSCPASFAALRISATSSSVNISLRTEDPSLSGVAAFHGLWMPGFS